MSVPFRIHPDNPKIFEFRRKPQVLITATEHYGAVINRRFRFERYLADAAEKCHTLTRLFVLFRKLQTSINPYSTCKPESPDYISPFKRVGPENALDGEPKYDLSQWNDEFFNRLHRFLSLASDYGVIVEVVLLSNTYADNVWALNPLHPKNNINGLEEFPWPDYMSLRHPEVFKWQSAHVRKIVQETNKYDNIFYEICNEPGSMPPEFPTHPTTADVDEWQTAIAEVIRETEKSLPNKHLIAGQEAYTWFFTQAADKSFGDFPIDIVNIHPLPDITFGGKSYHMGDFMSKQLHLRELRDFAQATYDQSKPLNYDEDNIATEYKDYDGWTIHRKRAWTTMFCGAHYDMIDFSIWPYLETGTPDSQKHIRTWMKHLSQFIHSVDLVNARPLVGWLRGKPEHVVESAFGVSGSDYCIYLADGRELNEPGAGEPIRGRLEFDLPEREFQISCFSPETGLYSPGMGLQGGGNHSLEIPAFQHDLVVRMKRV